MNVIRHRPPLHVIAQTIGASRLAAMLLLLWVSAMITMPILLWVYGPSALPWAVTLTVLLQLLCVLIILANAWPVVALVWTAGTVVVGAWVIEYLGYRTGLLFGPYDYTNLFRPQLGGVPLLVPLAWLMMLPPAWAVAGVLIRRSQRPVFVLTSALAFTAWDLFLDPQMVAWGAWSWPHGGGYFGIPWHNFAGWIVGAALLTALARPLPTPARPLVTIYTVTWVLQTIGLGIFWNAPWPALCGFLVMGLFVLLCWQAIRQGHPEPYRSPARDPRPG